MIIILVKKLNGDDISKTFGGIECDVCETPAPRDLNLHEMGWFIDGGQHRCPTHYHDDTPARGPQHRDVDEPTKKI